MQKIVFIPLDERPCNVRYPQSMFDGNDVQLVMPEIEMLGKKKIPADVSRLQAFLRQETMDADGLVVSMNMLLYGGIVPSRLHHLGKETLLERYAVLEEIKMRNPRIRIYASDLVMRCPQYSSNDEEPDYYQQCGLEIFLTGFLGHKKELGLLTPEEEKRLSGLSVPQDALSDFLGRRALNLEMNKHTIELVQKGIIDFLVIPQDDAAEYGHTSKDQKVLKKAIDEAQVNAKVYIYPGADEVANSLVSRMITHFNQEKPAFYVQYPSSTSGQTIPLLEDRTLDCTVRYQIRAAGGRVVPSMAEADILLFVNAPAERMMNNAYLGIERSDAESRKRNLVDFVESVADAVSAEEKTVAIADVFTLNGSDYELMNLLDQKALLDKIHAYAGWNTSSNTLGTTIPFAIQVWRNGMTKSYRDFLMSRYVEDFGYMAYVRTVVNAKLKAIGLNYFDVAGGLETVETMVRDELLRFVDKHLSSIRHRISLNRVWMPWKRMFEVGIDVSDNQE